MTSSEENSSRLEVALPPSVDIRSIGDFADKMKTHLAAATVVAINAEDFASGDVTLIQVLVSAGKAAVEQGGSFRIVNAGPALVALFDRCGIDATPLGLAHRQQEG